MKGRIPKPSNVKHLEGYRKDRINDNEPKPQKVAPDPPDWLDEIGLAKWRELAPAMERIGILTELDGMIFAALCQEYSRMVRAERVIAEKGITYEYTNTKKETNTVTRPEVDIAHKAKQLIRVYCSELGLTPSSRSRISLPGAKEENEDNITKMMREKKGG